MIAAGKEVTIATSILRGRAWVIGDADGEASPSRGFALLVGGHLMLAIVSLFGMMQPAVSHGQNSSSEFSLSMTTLGGVSILAIGNTFQKNVHPITSDGYAYSGYAATNNLFLSGNNSADADVHGPTAQAGDTAHDGGISGMGAQMVGNSFLRTTTGNNQENFSVRGVQRRSDDLYRKCDAARSFRCHHGICPTRVPRTTFRGPVQGRAFPM